MGGTGGGPRGSDGAWGTGMADGPAAVEYAAVPCCWGCMIRTWKVDLTAPPAEKLFMIHLLF